MLSEPGCDLAAESSKSQRLPLSNPRYSLTLTALLTSNNRLWIPMGEGAWQLEHSVEADVSPGFAWSLWTDVTTRDDPAAQFVLDGAFAAMTHLADVPR